MKTFARYAIATVLVCVIGIALMWGPRDVQIAWARLAQTATPTPAQAPQFPVTVPPIPPAATNVGADSTLLPAVAQLQSIVNAQNQSIMTLTAYVDWQQFEIQQLQAHDGLTAPPCPSNLCGPGPAPTCTPPSTIVNGVCTPPPPPPTCNPPNVVTNGVCGPPPQPSPKPVVPNGNVTVLAGGADQSKCFAGGPIVPAGTTGTVVAGPKTFFSAPCWNIDFHNPAITGWTPEAALTGQ